MLPQNASEHPAHWLTVLACADVWLTCQEAIRQQVSDLEQARLEKPLTQSKLSCRLDCVFESPRLKVSYPRSIDPISNLRCLAENTLLRPHYI